MGPENPTLATFNSGNNDELQRLTLSWHPKLTLYRLLVLLSTVGLGIAKAVTSYWNLKYASITLEWIAGVAVFICLHILGSYEEHGPSRLNWLFHDDYIQYLWNLLSLLGVDQPQYRSDESITMFPNPPITGYRILITILVVFSGTLKSALSFGNLQNDVTAVECVLGIGVGTFLYWLGLYEDSSAKVYPLLFHVDFAPTLVQGFTVVNNLLYDGIAVGVDATVVTGKLVLCLIGLTISVGVTIAFYELAKLTVYYRWYLAFFPEYPIVSVLTGVLFNFVMGLMSFGGVVFALGALYQFFKILFQVPVISRRRRIRHAFLYARSVYATYWDPSSPARPRDRNFYLKRLLFRQAIKLPMNVFVTIIFLFVVSFFFWLALMCAYVLATLLQSYVPVTLTFPLVCFISVPISILMSSVLVRDFYRGFLNYLSDIRNDYMDQGPLLPSSE